ncbi:MAG: NAD(+) synthase [Beijerinckiaceae bacterium]|nr:MAG: NAD(+) synthase [Beijerinckiaceae bacterium]
MSFRSIYTHGFVRVAACTHRGRVAEPAENASAILKMLAPLHERSVAVAVFPELALSSYAIDDLLLQESLLAGVVAAVEFLVEASKDLTPLIIVGAPLRHEARLYNCALAIHRGRLLGVVPKVYLPNYREFYEHRHFASGAGTEGNEIRVGALRAPFGPDLVFTAEDVDNLVVHAEICEDLWIPIPPSSSAALAGATVLVNLSASNITIGKSDTRRLLCQAQSQRCLAAYLYAAAGVGESTTDLAWDGQALVFENGALLAESPRFQDQGHYVLADVDLDLLMQERLRHGTFDDNRRNAAVSPGFRRIGFRLSPSSADVGLERVVERFPFVPANRERLAQDCYEAYNIQVVALEQRLAAAGVAKLVIGVSGGLDSTHALIVAAKAMDRLGLPRSNILAFTMPGFATSEATKTNAHALMRALNVESHELDIKPAARQMLADIGHPFASGEKRYDVTFENVQAGLRTDYLFRLANMHHALVLGTGDLSELALGWCTYGVGDQMSHYAINSGVPKTLIQYLLRWTIATKQFDEGVLATLKRILATEISPELVPSDAGTVQSTEAAIGPYELQDFNLYYVLRHGFRPGKIAFLAHHAWAGIERGQWPQDFPLDQRKAYDLASIRHWLEIFIKRFFGASQFKRSALPNGPKVVAGGALSPRGDWRAPSDGNANTWLADLEKNVPRNW